MSYSGPFVVKFLDGRERPLPGDPTLLFEEEVADAWAAQRLAGAVLLIDGGRSCIDHGYTEALIAEAGLAPGARVRHKDHPELVGRVDHYEFHQSGRLSAIPLTVYWDDPGGAFSVLGMFALYQSPENLERVDGATTR